MRVFFPTKVWRRMHRIAVCRGFAGSEDALFAQLLSAEARRLRHAQPAFHGTYHGKPGRSGAQTFGPLPSEVLSGRREARPHNLRTQLRWILALGRHGRTKYLGASPRETSWENAIYYRFHHLRGGPVCYHSPEFQLRRYAKERLRWRRIARDPSVAADARRFARAMLAGRPGVTFGRGTLAAEERSILASREAWDAHHARSAAQRLPAGYWFVERLEVRARLEAERVEASS